MTHIPARRTTTGVAVDHVIIGGSAPVVVQSMTNTDTADVEATVRQVRELALAGSELVRITVDTEASAQAAERFAAWQLEYLEALRAGDEATATELVSELADARNAIAQATADALETLGDEINADIVVLAGDIEATIASIPR